MGCLRAWPLLVLLGGCGSPRVCYYEGLAPRVRTVSIYDDEGLLSSEKEYLSGSNWPSGSRTLSYTPLSNGLQVIEEGTSFGYRYRAVEIRDLQGRTLSVEEDFELDGDIDYRYANVYDEHGNRIRHEEDRNGDGLPNHVIVTTYDEQGREIGYTVDGGDIFLDPVDGEIDEVGTYEYPSPNRRILTRDRPPSGIVEDVVTWTYDDQQRVLEVLTVHFVIEHVTQTSRETHRYDAASHTTEIDSNDDGTIDERTIETFDDGGRTLTRVSDRNADGQPETTSEYRYDDQGELAAIENTDEAGQVSWRLTYSTGTEGERVKEEESRRARATFDRATCLAAGGGDEP